MTLWGCHVICRTMYGFEGPTIIYCRKKSVTDDVTRSLQGMYNVFLMLYECVQCISL